VHPDVSVVVPTHNRPAGLTALLDAIRAQTLDAERFEVIVVDDGSQPPVADSDGVAVLRHDQPRGPGAARNTGWREARAPLVAFTDDDCIPAAGWLEALIETAGHDDNVIVEGPVRPPPEQEAELTPLSHTIERVEQDRLFATCNIAYSRAVLEGAGGFDESFRRSAEDVDLGTRATKKGATVRFAEQAVVHHEVRQPTLGELLRHTTKWTDSVKAVKRHPELREILVGGVFWKPTHPLLLLAAAGLAARRPVAALPYLAWYARLYHGDVRRLARALPKHVAVDITEVGTMAAGSVLHRTPVL
jgi:glycosyltransferase involved in cell wall biosynthesis